MRGEICRDDNEPYAANGHYAIAIVQTDNGDLVPRRGLWATSEGERWITDFASDGRIWSRGRQRRANVGQKHETQRARARMSITPRVDLYWLRILKYE